MLLVFVYLVVLFHLVVVSLSSFFCVFLLCVLHSLSMPMLSCLGCIPLLIRLAFLRSLVTTRMFSCCTRIMWLSFVCSSAFAFVCVFVSCLFFIYFMSPLCLFMATMSFAGYFLVRFILSTFPAFLHLTCPRFGLVDSAYLMTTAGLFVAGQLM